MVDPSYYRTMFYLSERDSRRAASYAMASVTRGVRYNPKSVAVQAVLEGGRPWTSRATWDMAKIALRRKHWKYFSVTRAVGFGWWCRARMEGMTWDVSVFVDAALRVYEYDPIPEGSRRLL